jgi:hypothetical protein
MMEYKILSCDFGRHLLQSYAAASVFSTGIWKPFFFFSISKPWVILVTTTKFSHILGSAGLSYNVILYNA